MRKFQVNGNPGLVDDVLGGYGHYDEKRLAEYIVFMNQYMEEKNIARHFPGVHWQELEMGLTDDFKNELLRKAEMFAKKKIGASTLTWELAKRCAANPEQINQDAILPIIKNIIVHAKPFADSPFLLESPPSSSEKKAHKEVQDTAQETKQAHEIEKTSVAQGDTQSPTHDNMLAFSFTGSSPSTSSSSTSDSLNAITQAGNNNVTVPSANAVTAAQQRAQVRKVWAANFPLKKGN